jgi:hypothetical protein
MTVELAFTPAGRLIAVEFSGPSSDEVAGTLSSLSGENAGSVPSGTRFEPTDGRIKRVVKAFAAGPMEGLFAQGTERFDAPLAPSLAYWRDYAGRFLTALCHTPESVDAPLKNIPPPEDAELQNLLLSVPPMQGAEYLSATALQDIWRGLSDWVRGRVVKFGKGLSGLLKEHAQLWHQRRNVLVHKFVCRGAVEGKIDALIEEKTQLAADLLEDRAEKMLTKKHAHGKRGHGSKNIISSFSTGC